MTTPAAPRDPERRTAEVALGSFSYTDEGAGPVIVAVHGLPGSARDYRWLGAALPDDVRFVRLELPAFGNTPLSSGPAPDVDGRGRFVAQALTALGIERCLLVGHSMGGAPVLSAAAHAPERVAALGLLASVGLRPHRLYRRFVGRSAFARAIDTPIVRAPALGLLSLSFRAAGFPAQTSRGEVAHTVRCVAALDFDAQAHNTATVRVPTLTAFAEDDAFIEPEVMAEHSTRLPHGPRLRWPTGGHNIQKSRAVELAEALVAFSREVVTR